MQRIGTLKANVFKKISREGKEYTQVAFSKAEKQQDGSYKETTMFLFPEDVAAAIAVLTSTLPQLSYVEPKNNGSASGYQPATNHQHPEPGSYENFDDDIPF